MNKLELRKAWLEENGRKEVDVMWEEDGEEYIVKEPTLMDEGEPEDTRLRKVYLPFDIQMSEEEIESIRLTEQND